MDEVTKIEKTPEFRRQLNKATHRLVIWFAFILGLVALLGNYYLTYVGKNVSGGLDALPYAVVTGMLAFLGKPDSHNEHMPQEVITPPGKPLETTDVTNAEQDKGNSQENPTHLP